MAAMRAGDFESAWRISDRILAERGRSPSWHLPRHEQWIWNGERLDGKRVLVRCYHGLGDTIQFIRFAPLLQQVASEVIVWAQPELLPLLARMHGIDRLLPLHDGTPDVDYDADIEVMELAHYFRATPDTLPREIPYLCAEAAEIPRGPGLQVGLVWQAGNWDADRSIPFRCIEGITSLPHTFHVLQRGRAFRELPEGWGMRTGTDDLAQAARVIAALDLVVSVDSMPAHLAGALGRPVWTLLQNDADWRWMDDREDTPWYPTMRLFRQEAQGDWTPVIARVADELRRL